MPSVQEELAELRARSLTKKNAEQLKDAGPLSTPEAEENAIRTELAKTKIGTYGKDAQSALATGATKGAVDQQLEFQMKTVTSKKSDLEKQREAAKYLQSFNQAKLQQSPSQKTTNDTTTTTNTNNTSSSTKAAHATTPVEDVNNDNKDTIPVLEEIDDDVPDLEEPPDLDDGRNNMSTMMNGIPAPANKINRAERKARNMMQKLGMRSIPGITQCTIKMGNRQGMFTINNPSVYEKNGSYVVFGEAHQGGVAPRVPSVQELQAQAIQKLTAPAPGGSTTNSKGPPKIEEVDANDAEEEEADESDVDPKDIDLVISQAGCSRAKAVKALKENDGDLVNAIMAVTA